MDDVFAVNNKNIMTIAQKSTIWLPLFDVQEMEFTSSPIEIKSIESRFIYFRKIQNPDINENLPSDLEQQKHSSYYRKLSTAIRNYEAMLLLDPADAKTAMFDLLKDDFRFS
jgi:hypothetical protein